MTRRILEFKVSRDQIQSAYIFPEHKGFNLVSGCYEPSKIL